MTLDQLLQALSEPKNFSQRINALYQQAINEAAKELPPQQTPSAAQISPHFEHIISEQLLYGLQFKNEALYPVVVDNKPEVPQAGHYFIAKHNSALQYATEEKDKTISRVTLDQDPQDIRILQGNNKTITLNQAEATNFIIKKTGHALELLQLIEQINNLDLDTEVKKILVNSLTLHHHQQEINLSTTYITPDEKLATKKAYLHELHKTLNNPDQTEVVKAINARKALNTSLIVTPGNLNTVLLNIDTDPDNTIHPRQRERIELGGLLGAFCTDTEFKALRKSERVLYDALIFDSKVSEALQKKLNLEVITLQTRNESDPEIGKLKHDHSVFTQNLTTDPKVKEYLLYDIAYRRLHNALLTLGKLSETNPHFPFNPQLKVDAETALQIPINIDEVLSNKLSLYEITNTLKRTYNALQEEINYFKAEQELSTEITNYATNHDGCPNLIAEKEILNNKLIAIQAQKGNPDQALKPLIDELNRATLEAQYFPTVKLFEEQVKKSNKPYKAIGEKLLQLAKEMAEEVRTNQPNATPIHEITKQLKLDIATFSAEPDKRVKCAAASAANAKLMFENNPTSRKSNNWWKVATVCLGVALILASAAFAAATWGIGGPAAVVGMATGTAIILGAVAGTGAAATVAGLISAGGPSSFLKGQKSFKERYSDTTEELHQEEQKEQNKNPG